MQIVNPIYDLHLNELPVDLVDVGACSAFLALAIIRGERLYEMDPVRCDEFDLYVMRRAGDLAHFERQRRKMLLTVGRTELLDGSL